MPGIENNLYPPIVLTTTPAFIRTNGCRIYFSLSSYNTPEDIKNVQIIINNQNTNLSVLDPVLYPSGIKITSLNVDNSIKADNKYYVYISSNDLGSKIFELNQYYKVQIRFTGINAENLIDDKKIASWLTNNQRYFSEWSTVCLIKGIEKPYIYLKNFENGENAQTNLSTDVVDFVGKMYYENNANLEKEYLKSYKIVLFYNSKEVFNSGIIYTNYYNPNEINYTLPYAIEDSLVYNVEFTFITNNNYTETIHYSFMCIPITIGSLKASIQVEPQLEYGCMKINVLGTESFFGNLTIRRTSSESNFTLWEDIKTEIINSPRQLDYTWYDYTIKSGVWYKYGVQRRNARGDRTPLVTTYSKSHPGFMIIFDDIFLTRKDMQLTIKYNPNITSFKRQVLESRTDTIGSKFPFIRRNANVNYKTFSISGLITAFCDEEGRFINKNNIYNENFEAYKDYNNENNITEYQDFIYEREFREKVMDFLYDNNIKLYRSATEGNILVKLMDISFTPNQTLGRMLYSFNATAYEIDECSIDNYNKYEIQDKGDFSSYIEYDYLKLGQIKIKLENNQNDIISTIQNKIDMMSPSAYINKIQHLTWIRIQIESEPYLIKTNIDGTLSKINDGDNINEDIISGYIIVINGEQVLIGPRGYYELLDNDTEITSIQFPFSLEATIDYLAAITQTENIKKLAKRISYTINPAQLWGTFEVDDLLSKKIYLKYYLDYPKYYQSLLAIDKITIAAAPGTICYIKDSFDDATYRHQIGDTGILELYDDEAVIMTFYFHGIHLSLAIDKHEDDIKDNEYLESNLIVNSLDEINYPKKNNVYNLKSGERYIYYNNEFYEFSNEDDVLCPVTASVDYIYELVKGEYE